MAGNLITHCFRQCRLLIVVALVLLATYVSLGRQFMPAISRYTDFLENQILAITGVPVRVEAISGSFEGFNPVINISGLKVLVGDDPDPDAGSALLFETATIEVDMFGSLMRRQWVLAEFLVDNLAIDLVQTDTGAWQIEGISGTSGGTADIEGVYEAFQRVSHLDLENVSINLRNRLGEAFRFSNGVATIQNQGQAHYFHVDANLAGSNQPVSVSLVIRGNRLDRASGRLHASIPPADYSELSRSLQFGEYEVTALNAEGELWFDFTAGEFASAIADLEIDALSLLTGGGQVSFERLAGLMHVRRSPSGNGWQAALNDLTVDHGEHAWEELDAYVFWEPGQLAELRANRLDLGLLSEIALQSGLLPEAAGEQLLGYAPSGLLNNFNAVIPLSAAVREALVVQTNLSDVALGSVRGSPEMWGLDGYLGLRRDSGSGLLTGVAEIESERLRLHIPDLFTEAWSYDFVNGRLRFEVDTRVGQRITLASDVIVAESPIIDGRVRFASVIEQSPEGERDSELELLIGASRIAAEQKSPYLPDGPQIDAGLRGSMEFIDGAIVSGIATDSSVLYRGKTQPDSGPATKTFQSVFRIEQGVLDYSPDWPELTDLSATVVTDDNNIDIAVSGGSSLDLELISARGIIREDDGGGSLLSIRGDAAGQTDDGLSYLQAAPLDAKLRETFASWEAEGDFAAQLDIQVPLSQPESEPEIRLAMQLVDNGLTIGQYGLRLDQLDGPILFATRSGLGETSLTARLFDRPINLELSSTPSGAGGMAAMRLLAQGAVSPESLAAWSQQPVFVQDLLRQMQGDLVYQATLDIDQTAAADFPTKLTVQSTMQDVEVNLPQPFAKPAGQASELSLEIGFAEAAQRVSGVFGEDTQFQLDLKEEGSLDGVITVGVSRDRLPSLVDFDSDGLIVIGDVPEFQLQQWTEFIGQLSAPQSPDNRLLESLAFIEVDARQFSAFGQDLAEVGFRIEPDPALEAVHVALDGAAVRGSVMLPWAREDYLQLELEYLHLPGEEDTGQQSAAELATDTDPLAEIDPRALPAMRFATADLKLGDSAYGSWQFTLNPTAEGAEFSDLAFDFRGLRLGLDELDASVEQLEPHFSWHYDGNAHRSALTGVLISEDIGQVLLANGLASSLISEDAAFVSEVNWPGSPAWFSATDLSGEIDLRLRNGRFLQDGGGGGALKLVSILNFSAIMRRLRFSDDLLRRGLAFDEISGRLKLDDGLVQFQDRLVISGPSSLYQITGEIDLQEETINGEMFVTLPVSDNIPWLGLLTANIPFAVGAYLFDQIFGDQVDSLTSAVYTLQGPWDGLQPEFKQAFGSPEEAASASNVR